MIDMTERLVEQVDDATTAIKALNEEIRKLPDTKIVNVIYRITTVGKPPAGADVVQNVVNNVAKGGNVENIVVGGSAQDIIRDAEALAQEAKAARDAAGAQEQLAASTAKASAPTAGQIRDAFRVGVALEEERYNLQAIIAAQEREAEVLGLNAAAVGEQIAQLEEESAYEQRLIELGHQLAEAETEVKDTTVGRAEAMDMLTQAMKQGIPLTERFLNTLQVVQGASAESATAIAAQARAMAKLDDNSNHSGLVMLALAKNAAAAGDSMGRLVIPTGAAAFGMTGAAVAFGLTAQAIHLIIMGTFEFLAVFVPAMYAGAAAALVMKQGAQNVQTYVQSLFTATSALGDMLNTTAGDALKLGHSLSTAQDAAQPGVYELFGEAIMGANAAMGRLNSQGLSPFGQLGLDVTHMLDAFGAKLVVDIQQNMTGVNQLLQNGAQDLREFGQILGNTGHAIFDFAKAMPGAAELVLKLLDAISWLIKEISQLPAPILYAIMVIEELYRWSGVLMGIFGMLGRGIALLGTLGIPVFAKIGMNFGTMVANIITGVGSAIINFVAMGEKIGVFGKRVDEAAIGIVGGLGRAAEFMTGPWGAALALGGLAIAGLILWAGRFHSAAQQFVIDTQKMIIGSVNLTVLDSIASTMGQTVQKTAQAGNDLANAQIRAGQTAAAAGGAVGGAATRFNDLAGAAGVAAGQVNNARDAVQTLTAYQSQLYQQSLNVVEGASYISKTYKVDFVSALAMADMAGVKLTKSITDQSQAAQQARIQLQAMFNAYQQMDQTGTILTNTMAAINVQAGLQSTKVSQVNQAWDQFIQNATGLTSSFSQFQLDLQQMGNIASTTGSKIQAFSGNTTLSISQVAQSLTSFSGTSAQSWQAFDQSAQAANSFIDQMRIAAAALGPASLNQKTFTQAIASTIQQLIPFAQNSKAAQGIVRALASEIGGPATGSFQDLVNWIDKNSVGTQKFGGFIDTLTQKMSNVTQIAKNFAGTLQSDIMNAIGNAAVATSGITQLTVDYTNALMTFGANSPQAQKAQKNLTDAMLGYHFSQTEVSQTEQILQTEYGKSGRAADNLGQGHIKPLTGTVYTAENHMLAMADEMGSGLPAKTGTAGSALDTLRNQHFLPLQQMIMTVKGWTEKAERALSLWPPGESTNVQVTGSGGASITSTVPGAPQGTVRVNPVQSRLAGGGVLPGYSPGHDSVLAMLSPGEGILTPQAVRMIGPDTVHGLNSAAKHFASGGMVLPDVTGFGQNFLATSGNSINQAFSSVLSATVKSITASAQQVVNAFVPSGGPSGASAQMAQRMAMAMAGSLGWNWGALNNVAMRESGWSMTARNPTSGAYGIAQFINGPSEYYQYGGNPNTLAGQLTAFFAYISQRYGNPTNAWAHEVAYGWYDNGGYLMPGLTMAFNGTGKPEKVSPSGGEGTIIHNVVNLDGQTIWENQQTYTLRYSARNSGRAVGIWSPL